MTMEPSAVMFSKAQLISWSLVTGLIFHGCVYFLASAVGMALSPFRHGAKGSTERET